MYYFIDFTKNTADIVGEAYPGLIDAQLGEVRVISYEARDGAMVPAYLTLPPGSEGKNLPLVVLPHGGPEARDEELREAVERRLVFMEAVEEIRSESEGEDEERLQADIDEAVAWVRAHPA